MPYGELMVAPMREELTSLGIRELRTPDEVDAFLEDASDRSAMVVVNSVCGCAAGSLRPAVAEALEHSQGPDALGTVFAGQDVDATERAREHFAPHPPSSPAVALFGDGELVHMMPREEIQGRPPQQIAQALKDVFDRHCAAPTAD